MIPLSTHISRIRTRYDSASGGSSTRWSDSRIQDFINEGLESLAESTLFYERYTTVPIQENRTWYDLRGFTPETVVRIRSIWNQQKNIWLNPINPMKLDPRWEQRTGSPEAFFTRGIYWFAVYPKSDAALTNDISTQGYMRVFFAGIPSRFTNTQQVLRDLPEDYFVALYDYVLSEMASIDGRTPMALHYWQSYQDRENRLSKFVGHRVDGARVGSIGRF